MEKRKYTKAEPGSLAEKEAMLLLEKISFVNNLANAQKQPVQKIELKRFIDEMEVNKEQPT